MKPIQNKTTLCWEREIKSKIRASKSYVQTTEDTVAEIMGEESRISISADELERLLLGTMWGTKYIDID